MLHSDLFTDGQGIDVAMRVIVSLALEVPTHRLLGEKVRDTSADSR